MAHYMSIAELRAQLLFLHDDSGAPHHHQRVPPAHVQQVSVLASTRENGILHFLHTCGTIYCRETGVHISAFNLEEAIGYPAHTGLISPSVHTSVCLFVHLSGIRKHVEFSRRN
jgi:hypothetical protein